jgi:hypothetical protein
MKLEIPIHRHRLLPPFSDFSLAKTDRFTGVFESPCDWREFWLFVVVLVACRQGALDEFTLFGKAHMRIRIRLQSEDSRDALPNEF